MSGYAASARIVRASPRILDHGRVDRAIERPVAEPVAVVIDGGVAVAVPPTISLAERWGRFLDRWDQLTFFVTDPESWR